MSEETIRQKLKQIVNRIEGRGAEIRAKFEVGSREQPFERLLTEIQKEVAALYVSIEQGNKSQA